MMSRILKVHQSYTDPTPSQKYFLPGYIYILIRYRKYSLKSKWLLHQKNLLQSIHIITSFKAGRKGCMIPPHMIALLSGKRQNLHYPFWRSMFIEATAADFLCHCLLSFFCPYWLRLGIGTNFKALPLLTNYNQRSPLAERYLSASIAAWQPVPAAVIAWR